MVKSLKIGLVLDTSLDPPDGVQQYVIGVGEWLRRKGHDVHYLVGQTEKCQLPNIHSLARNITVRFNGNQTTVPLPASRRKLRNFLKNEQFDILHVQVPHSPFMAQRLILAADQQTALIGTFHIAPTGKFVSLATSLLGIWLRPSLKRFDRMLSVSLAAESFAKSTIHVDSTISPNVIDYRRYHRAQPLAVYDDNVFTILFLGRLVPRKGCQLLLSAVKELIQQPDLPPFRVLICGKGHQEAKLRAFVSDNQLENVVFFLGFISEADKPRYYASADISVFPSSGGESFGIVLLEAMASGRSAILAGDNPGYHSVLHEKPELLFDPRSVEALGDKLRHYLLQAERRLAARQWGEKYTKAFDINRVGEQLLEVYQAALSKRRKR